MDWIPMAEKVPPESEIVHTKCDDERGLRNEQLLVRQGRLFFFPDHSMYVYYCPTHWRSMTDSEREAWRAAEEQKIMARCKADLQRIGKA